MKTYQALHRVADRVQVHDRYYLEDRRVQARDKNCWEERRVLVHRAPVCKALAHMVRVRKVQACKVLVGACSSDLAPEMQHGHKDLKHEKEFFLFTNFDLSL
jgi:hypothetical protein